VERVGGIDGGSAFGAATIREDKRRRGTPSRWWPSW